MSSAVVLLAEVEAAISNTLTAQSYSAPGGRQKQMAALSELRKFRTELLQEITTNGSGNQSMASLCSIEGAR